MRNKRALPELLAPAGDFDCLKAAVYAGADAVYLGGKRFGARAFAKNFDIEELKQAVIFCHTNGVRLYVTINTLIYDREMKEALSYAEELWAIGVDAIIAADIGFCREIKKRIPEIELHASTQMGIHNSLGADFAYDLGCSRVVLARECSGEDIEKIVSKSKAECEVFVHGALCVCHSGQCLFSSMIGGRSGNRGECAQPCRLPYGGKYPLSLSDLSLAGHVKRLISMGVSSLKVEGRMKSPEYVYTVISVYRKLLDEGRAPTGAELAELKAAFNRGDFTDGYFVGRYNKPMTGVRTEEEKRASRQQGKAVFSEERLPVSAKAEFKLGEPSRLTLTAPVISRWDGIRVENSKKFITVSAEGEVCTEAISSPLSTDSLAARISKLGGTPFVLNQDNLELTLDAGVNLSFGAINALRRAASEALTKEYIKSLEILNGNFVPTKAKSLTCEKPSCVDFPSELNTALFLNGELYKAARNKPYFKESRFDIVFLPIDFPWNQAEYGVGAYLPPVIMERELDRVKKLLTLAREAGVKYALVGNVSHFGMISALGFEAVADFRLNISNSLTAEFYKNIGTVAAVLSPELTLPMARDIGGGLIVCGRIPLMLTERCFVKENFGCDKCGKAAFTDRTGVKFPLIKEWEHRNIILNSTHTYMGDKLYELKAAGITHRHFIFSVETEKELSTLLCAYNAGLPITSPHRRIGRR